MTPRATYRLQFGPGFGFADAAALAPYLGALGISHAYLAPVFAARPASTHGYDVTDPTTINPELGGEPAFRSMAAAFRAEGIGLLLDIVPNHMGIGGESNAFWLDVLEWGPQSRFAGWFDIDWAAGDGKVLLPVLGEPMAAALASGALELRADPDGGFSVWAHGTHRLPVTPPTWGRVLRAAGEDALATRTEALDGPCDPGLEALRRAVAGVEAPEAFRDPAALAGLLDAQHWRAAKFSLDRDALNYRRFFAISDLAGLRIEDPAVFEATQRLALDLVGEGVADGLRIDHIDGLRDPKAYLAALRAGADRPFWLLVEKIVAPDETLPPDWDADGTTGYEVANLLVGLLPDPAGMEAMADALHAFTGAAPDPEATVREAKREAVTRMLGSELAALARRLLALAEGRDLGEGAVRTALIETIAAFPVYRTYADADGIAAGDIARVRGALAEARAAAPWAEPAAFDLVEEVLTLQAGPDGLEAALRFQQLSGPAMAKGLEDTALYRLAWLIALNEVGSHPGRAPVTAAEFHAANTARLATPRAMLATSTHDTKRGEDARARIAALPRHAAAWATETEAWHRLLDDPTAPVDRTEAYFLFQLLLGAWPMDWRVEPDAAALAALAERVQAGMLKSVREAGTHTRWVFGDQDHEDRLAAYISRALAPGSAFLARFRAFEQEIARDGAANALIQAALKLTIPGIPDVYRGAEVWEQSLVDPDNRRPLDFGALSAALAALPPGAAAFEDWTAPSAKLALTARLLAVRAAHPALFAQGDYVPVDAPSGTIAFLRSDGEERLLVAAALRHAGAEPATLPLQGRWHDLLTDSPAEGTVTVPGILPVTVLLQA